MNKLETYIWKDKRLSNSKEQAEWRLIDMGEDQLKQCYQHCKNMLYNNSPNNLGRMLVLDLLDEQIEKCGAELAFRWFKSLRDANGNLVYSDESLMSELREMIPLETDMDYVKGKKYKLQDYFTVPAEFKTVDIKLLQDACRDKLGYFDHSKITMRFLNRLGIYLTHAELNEMNNYTQGHTLKEKFEVIKRQLGLDEFDLRANPNGLTEQEFRDMIHIKTRKGTNKCKYSEMSTNQLKVLRKKVLYALEDEVLVQIKLWETLLKQIEEVAEYNHINLE